MKNELVPLKEIAEVDKININDVFVRLARIGSPRLSLHGQGWHSVIELNLSAKGARFEVATDFRSETPELAVKQLVQRVIKTMDGFGA